MLEPVVVSLESQRVGERIARALQSHGVYATPATEQRVQRSPMPSDWGALRGTHGLQDALRTLAVMWQRDERLAKAWWLYYVAVGEYARDERFAKPDAWAVRVAVMMHEDRGARIDLLRQSSGAQGAATRKVGQSLVGEATSLFDELSGCGHPAVEGTGFFEQLQAFAQRAIRELASDESIAAVQRRHDAKQRKKVSRDAK